MKVWVIQDHSEPYCPVRGVFLMACDAEEYREKLINEEAYKFAAPEHIEHRRQYLDKLIIIEEWEAK